MRGKLRDKRSEAKRDGFKRVLLERRPARRDNRNITWQHQELDEEEETLLEETAEVVVEKKGK